jgi:DNA polymerase-1
MDSLWGDDFIIKTEPKEVKKIVKKVKEPKDVSDSVKRVVKSKSVDIHSKLQLIYENVKRILGRYADNTQIIKTRQDLHDYISKAIENGIIALDTETNNSLVPITCKLMGPCLYTPGLKNAYVPINHVDVNTKERLSWQLTEQDVFEELNRLNDSGTQIKVITHNGKFDYEVFKCTTSYEMKVYWDTFIGAKILDENERSHGLKQQYIDKVDPSIEKYDIEHLFEGVEYAVVDPDIFALYAATDSFMTYKLYLWQKEQFELPDNKRLYSLFMDVEMPILEVTAQMELDGVCIDTEYSKLLSAKYHKELDKVDETISNELLQYKEMVNEWFKTDDANYHPPKKTGEGFGKSKAEQLEDPINLGSPTQLAILLYDILKVPPVDKNSPRGTGEPILEKIDLPICKLILERRGLLKLLSTYIDKFPEMVLEPTGRLHAHFLQLGAGTGRFSSQDPNLQNIPSKNKEIRLMFKAADGYSLVGSDFSAQEPRTLAEFCQDENMLNAYYNNQDLYAVIAQKVHNNNYWDNMEHHEDGSANPDGKKRRSEAKSILLGLMYGRGNASIAEQIGGTYEQAEQITEKFFNSFPKVKVWIDKTQEDCKRLGYVEDFWGRRRRLPDIQLPKFTIKDTKDKSGDSTFNPILGCLGKVTKQDNPSIKKYQTLLENMKGRKEYDKIKDQAQKEGITIVNNGSFIAQAERQCVNARIQGSSATLTKKAMINVYRDPILKKYGFKLLLAVHDELIGECLDEYRDECAKRLTEVMVEAASDMKVPMKCDPTVTKFWYEDEIAHKLQKFRDEKFKDGLDMEAVVDLLAEEHLELTRDRIYNLLNFED